MAATSAIKIPMYNIAAIQLPFIILSPAAQQSRTFIIVPSQTIIVYFFVAIPSFEARSGIMPLGRIGTMHASRTVYSAGAFEFKKRLNLDPLLVLIGRMASIRLLALFQKTIAIN